MQPDDIKALIEAHLSDAVADVDGDGRHFEARVISSAFAGVSGINRHRAVYAALGDRMHTGEVHALSIKALTPDEWAAEQTAP